MMKAADTVTVLGKTSRLRGDLVCDGDLQIDGSFEGSIRQNGGRVTIGPESTVRAHIIAQDVVVSGVVEGDIRAIGSVDLRSTAVVNGDIFAGRLSMEENAMLRGKVDPSRAGEREVPLPAYAAPQLVEQPISAELRQPEFQEAEEQPVEFHQLEFRQPEPRQPEHRQAVPLREDSSSAHRIQAVMPFAGERQLPSALAAFAYGGRRDLTEQGFQAQGARNEKIWHNSDTE